MHLFVIDIREADKLFHVGREALGGGLYSGGILIKLIVAKIKPAVASL